MSSSSTAIAPKICLICCGNVRSQPIDTTEKMLHCRHIFHRTCIDGWLRKGHACPACLSKVAVATYKDPETGMTAEECAVLLYHGSSPRTFSPLLIIQALGVMYRGHLNVRNISHALVQGIACSPLSKL